MSDKVEINGKVVVLDENLLATDNVTPKVLLDYNQHLAVAENNYFSADILVDRIFYQQFLIAKENGLSDKLAEINAKASSEYQKAQDDVITTKLVYKQIQGYVDCLNKTLNLAIAGLRLA